MLLVHINVHTSFATFSPKYLIFLVFVNTMVYFFKVTNKFGDIERFRWTSVYYSGTWQL